MLWPSEAMGHSRSEAFTLRVFPERIYFLKICLESKHHRDSWKKSREKGRNEDSSCLFFPVLPLYTVGYPMYSMTSMRVLCYAAALFSSHTDAHRYWAAWLQQIGAWFSDTCCFLKCQFLIDFDVMKQLDRQTGEGTSWCNACQNCIKFFFGEFIIFNVIQEIAL